MKNNLNIVAVSGFLLSLFVTGSAHATLNVKVLDTSLDVGSTATLSIEITGTGDLVAFSSLELRITPHAGNTGGTGLQFLDPDSANYVGDANYLFGANSFNLINGNDSSIVSTTSLPSDTFVDNDSDNDFLNQTINGNYLLASVQVQHFLPALTDPDSVLGDQFNISVIGTGGNAGTGDDFLNTNFLDEFGDPVIYTSMTGTVTLNATAVPEPGSFIVLTAIGCGAYLRRRRAKRSISAGNLPLLR